MRCELDDQPYQKGITVTDRQIASLTITPDPFHGEWKYTIHANQSV